MLCTLFSIQHLFTHTYVHSTKKKSISFFCMICRKLLNFSPCQRMICNCNFWECICIFFLMFSLKKNKYSKLFATIIFFLLQNSSINHFSTFFSEKKNYFLKSILKINSELKGLYVIGRNLRYIRRPLKLFYLNLPFFCVFFGKSRIWNMGLKSGKKCNCSS